MLGSGAPANGGLYPQPPGSHSFGQTLAQWQATWVAWALGDLALPTDTNGNALVNGVVLTAIPNAPGDGTPGSTNLTLNSGEPFVVPLILVLGQSFSNGTTEPMISVDDFEDMTLTLTLDGTTILDSDDTLRFYTETVFSPPLAFNAPPANGIAWVQGISIAHTPLPPGQHVLKLDEKIVIPERGLTQEFHNTLNITVVPAD
jgi:hypothetical protein